MGDVRIDAWPHLGTLANSSVAKEKTTMASILNRFPDDRTRARRLREFLHECAGSAACEEADRVREALLELGGSGVRANGPLDVMAVHSMIESGAATDAALAIIGDDASFMLSRGKKNLCMASVIHGDGSDEALAEGQTLALALLAAHVSAVLSRIEKGSETAEAQPAPVSMRLH